MRHFAPAVVAASLLLTCSSALMAQDAGPAHAPDGRAPQLISPLYFSPKPNAPFTATARTVSLAAADPETFKVPAGYRIIDQRDAGNSEQGIGIRE